MARYYDPVDLYDDDFADFLDDPDDYGDFSNCIVQISDEDAFYTAIVKKNITELTSLIEKGVNVNIKLQDGWTPLMLTAYYGDLDLTKLLINFGADVNFCGEKYTILMAACSCNDPTVPSEVVIEIVQLLIDKGADVTVTNGKKINALMCAAGSGRVEVVKMLLPHCDVKAKDYQGWTALFWAVTNQQIEVTKLLLEEGCSYSVTDVHGDTPLQLAKAQDNEDLLNLFPFYDDYNEYIYIDSTKTFEDFFENLGSKEKPQFFSDVCNILLAVDSKAVIKNLADNNIDLAKFLTITDEQLKDCGVILPFQRQRILGGIHKLHLYPYKKKSIPIINPKQECSTIDVSYAIFSCIKQIIVVEAGIKYIKPSILSNVNNLNEKDMKNVQNKIIILKKNILSLKKTILSLQKRAIQWDLENEVPDLITKDTIKNNCKSRKGVIYITYTLFLHLIHYF